MHPHFGEGYVRPWGATWVPHHWVGGYWGGVFWPSVTLGWNFPWFMAALPIGYTTFWYGSVPYYYWQGVYYVWSPDYENYVVTDPPPVTGDVQGAAPPPDETAGPDSLNLYVYPMRGQDAQQTADDKYQCHEWAVSQTGFDPTDPAATTNAANATPSDYTRAMTACLDARGYSVR